MNEEYDWVSRISLRRIISQLLVPVTFTSRSTFRIFTDISKTVRSRLKIYMTRNVGDKISGRKGHVSFRPWMDRLGDIAGRMFPVESN